MVRNISLFRMLNLALLIICTVVNKSLSFQNKSLRSFSPSSDGERVLLYRTVHPVHPMSCPQRLQKRYRPYRSRRRRAPRAPPSPSARRRPKVWKGEASGGAVAAGGRTEGEGEERSPQRMSGGSARCGRTRVARCPGGLTGECTTVASVS